MNWELLIAGGGTLAVVALAFLYARASTKAGQVDQVRKVNEVLLTASKAQRGVLVEKEDYIRELERTVLAGMPATELAARLNRLFADHRRRTSSAVSAAKRGSGTTTR